MTFVSRWGLAATIFLAAPGVFAAEDDDAHAKPALQLEIAPTTGALIEHRASSSVGGDAAIGWSFGGALRGYHGIHGFLLSYTGVATELTSVGLGRGPSTHYIEPGYSIRLGDSRALREHVGVSLALDLGPSLAFVERTLRDDPSGHSFVDVPGHATFGGRVSLNLALHVYGGFLGLDLGYRGGLPIDAASARWEGAMFTQASLGIELDTPSKHRR